MPCRLRRTSPTPVKRRPRPSTSEILAPEQAVDVLRLRPQGVQHDDNAPGDNRAADGFRDRDRIAIGARPAHVLRLVMNKGLALVGIDAAIGLAMGLAAERLFNAMLFNAGGVDLLAYLVIVPSLLAVTTLAAYVPARRASRIAPTQALGTE